MALSVGAVCIKYLLFLFNFIFVLTGIILLTVGAVIRASYYDYDQFLDDGFFSIPALLIAIGSIVFVVSFFGCCGAFKENYCMTITFCVFLILIFVLELVGGISGYILRDRAAEVIESRMNKSMDAFDPADNMTNFFWNDMQTSLHCCGVKNSTDWAARNKTLPDSCCLTLGPTHCDPKSVYSQGCLYALENVVVANADVLGGVGIAIAVIQLLGIIFACNLITSIRKDYETV